MTPTLLKRLPLAAAALLALCAGASQAQSVALTDPTFSAAALGYPLSWSIGSGTPELVGGQLDLDAGDSVYQSFTLSGSGPYTVSFDAAGVGRSRLFLSSSVGLFGTVNPDTLALATSGASLNAVTDWGSTRCMSPTASTAPPARPTTCTSRASAPASCWTTSRSPRRFRNPRPSR